MGIEKAKTEAKRWFGTAASDLETARILLDSDRHAHACFHAQQAGEKAVKSLWYAVDADPWSHSIQKLIQDLKDIDVSLYESLKDRIPDAVKLDRFYIPTRYPNGLPDLVPEQAFFKEDSRLAISLSESLLRAINNVLEID